MTIGFRENQAKCSIFFSLVISVLCIATPASAMPILSSDNSLLSGVEVDGVVYDITFGDGKVRDFYPVEDVRAAGWSDFSISMIDAIINALNLVGGPLNGSDIPGCTPHTGSPEIGVGVNECFLYMPTYYFVGDRSYQVGDVILAGSGGARKYSAQIYGRADLYADTANRGFSVSTDLISLVQINVASATVPNPATWLLLLVAMGGVQVSRKKMPRGQRP